MFVSDVHYRPGLEHTKPGSSLGLEKVKEMLEREKPDLLLSAGDWDYGFTSSMFEKLAEKTHILTIYGNHDNIKGLRNARNKDGSPILIPDAKPVDYKGLRIAGISGNLGSGKKWHHKTAQQFNECVEKLVGKDIDVLITHEAPARVPFLPSNPYGKKIVLHAVERIKPKLHFSGHVEYPTQKVNYNGVTFLHVDSGPPAFEYIVGEFKDGELMEMMIRRTSVNPLRNQKISYA